MSETVVYVVLGQARPEDAAEDSAPVNVSVMLTAEDADAAVDAAYDALEEDGFDDIQLDQVGEIDEVPDNELKAPYEAAVAGEIAIIEYTE